MKVKVFIKKLVEFFDKFPGVSCFLAVSIFASLFLIASFIKEPVYRLSVVLEPVEQKSMIESASSMLGGLSSIGDLAGFDLSSLGGSDVNSAQLASKIMETREFFARKIYDEFLAEIMAVDTWDKKTRKLHLDKDVYSSDTNTWLDSPTFLDVIFDVDYNPKPSFEDAFKKFHKEIFSITEDLATGFYVFSVTHQSPDVAEQLAKHILSSINEFMVTRDSDYYKAKITNLGKSNASTSNVLIRKKIMELIEMNTSNYMLVMTSEEHIFRVIQPPYIPEKKHKPSRKAWMLIGVMFGFGIFLLITFRKRLLRFLVQ